ncbi:MAG: hypothetical protein KGL35_22530 [Bradyrhizobium sp.]|uniref:hypothetical protein n=1 Tax=Bradyrhizobium sp. TaxID=376 RepID=UPI002384A60F|nr:hypothetical protein [Bradyrhizobium sp.]MDE2471426.1 hypothetical protein [Bradyrhizobium sp.]
MAPIDLGPAILAQTNHEVFAAPYHHNNDGNLATLNPMLARPSAARQRLSDRHVDRPVGLWYPLKHGYEGLAR